MIVQVSRQRLPLHCRIRVSAGSGARSPPKFDLYAVSTREFSTVCCCGSKEACRHAVCWSAPELVPWNGVFEAAKRRKAQGDEDVITGPKFVGPGFQHCLWGGLDQVEAFLIDHSSSHEIKMIAPTMPDATAPTA